MVDIKRDAGSFGWECRRQRIAVSRPFPPLATCIRLTIGTQAEMDEAMPAILGCCSRRHRRRPAFAKAPARDPTPAVDWVAGDGC